MMPDALHTPKSCRSIAESDRGYALRRCFGYCVGVLRTRPNGFSARVRTLAVLAAALAPLACKGTTSNAQEASVKAPAALAASKAGPNAKIVFDTSFGDIEVELFRDKAPKGVANFLRYAEEKLYDGTVFHRILPNFVVQGGGFEPDLTKKKTYEPLQNEADNGLKNERGTLSWARTPDPNSATNQFYINLKDNPALDHQDKSPRGWGYAVFGRVTKGLDIADKISQVPTRPNGQHFNFPADPVVVRSVRMLQR